MARVGSLMADDLQRARDLAEAERLRLAARAAGARMESVAEKIQRMNRLYRERLEGNRDRDRSTPQ